MGSRVIPIPNSSGQLVDVDVNFDGSWVASYRHGQAVVVETPEIAFHVPSARYGSFVRLVGSDRILLVDGRARPALDNVFLLDRKGAELGRFSVGGAVRSVAVTAAGKLVVGYMDSKIFGSAYPAREGLCVFDLEGCLEYGYHSMVKGAVKVEDCCIMCTFDFDGVCFTCLPGDELVLFDVFTRRQIVHEVPDLLRGSQALVCTPRGFIFHSPHGASNEVYRWSPGAIAVEHLGQQPGQLRGLRDGYFLVVNKESIHVLELGM